MPDARRLVFGLALLGLLSLPLCLMRSHAQQTNPRPAIPAAPLQGEAALNHLKQQGQFASLQEAIQQARFTVQRAEHTPLGRPAWCAPNAAAGYDGYVTEEGVSIALKNQSYVSLTLRGLGYGYPLPYVSAGEVSGDKLSLTITRNGQWASLKEWYVNGAGGLEQGFTLSEPPSGGKGAGQKLRLALEVSAGWRAVASDDGTRVTLLGQAEGEVVEYGKLVVWDGHGSPVKAALRVADERVIIEVDDSNANYPLTIDPVFALQQKVTALDDTVGKGFGSSVALSGETVVVGAYSDDAGANSNQGAAYVYVRSGTIWTEQRKLTASDGATNDYFGSSVALSGETVVVGAYGDDAVKGSSYFFTQPGPPAHLQAKLTASDGAAYDFFGVSVAISGETVVVGAHSDDVGANGEQGSAYVFVRSGTTWTQQQKLTASDGAAIDGFGDSVALSGETVVVGAYGDDVGANGEQGSAYVFVRSGTTWTQQQKLTASDGAPSDHFGESVAISGEMAVVGAPYDTVGANYNQGSAYVFVRSGTTWTQQQKLTASDGAASDWFGRSVTLSGETAVVGAPRDEVGTNSIQGSAYVFVRSGTIWTQQQKLTASDGAASDIFGGSVALSGEMAVIGVPYDTVGANANQGSAYVFVRSGTTWTQQQKLTASDGAAGDSFGTSVAISGDTMVVGPHYDNVGANALQGSAYIFVPCHYDLIPTSQSFPTAGGISSFTISCASSCQWTAVALPECITITSSASGSGNGTVSFTVAANSGLPRSSSISVSGSSFVITQAGTCGLAFTTSPFLQGGIIGTPYNQTLSASGGTGTYSYQLINAATLPPGLAISAAGVISGTPTFGSQGYYSFTIAVVDAVGCVGIRGYTMNIVNCGVTSLTPASATPGNAGGTGTFTVTAPGCAWTALSHAPWLAVTINASGTGNAVVTYAFASNVGAARTGYLTVNDKVFTVTQSGGGTGLQFYPLPAPVRLLDTRNGTSPNACSQPNAPLTGGASRTQPGRAFCTIPASAVALTGNITTVQSGGGFLTLYPSDAAQPTVANTNFAANQVRNNVFTVGLGADGAFKIFATTNTEVVVDITGYYAPPGAGGLYFHPLPKPIRLLETRTGQPGYSTPGMKLSGNTDTPQLGRGLTYDGVTIPASAQALVGNATTVNPGGGFLTLYPQGAARPLVASSNFLAGEVMNAPFTVGLGASGNFMIYVTQTMDLVVDVLGYYSAELVDVNGMGLLFSPLPTPVRLLDTRAGVQVGCDRPNAALAAASTRTQAARGTCTIPATAQGIVGNVTTVNPSANGFLTFYPSGATPPLAATSNFRALQVFNRHFTVGLGNADGAFKIYTSAGTELVVDVAGYFAP